VKQVVLLRGVNVGGRNKLAMPALRKALEGAGMSEVATYLQSGNVVLEADADADELAQRCEALIAERFDLAVAVVVRSGEELARVVRRDPLGDVVEQPKLYQVSFCSGKPSKESLRKAGERAVEGERIVVHGREIYAWFPHGVGRSRLAAQLARQDFGVVATARNWTTVTKLLELAEG
jgi:uncharacterized protein (DUF1697 family)